MFPKAVLLTAVVVLGVGCGEDLTSTSSTTGSATSSVPGPPVDADSVIAAGLLTEDDLPVGGQYDGWEEVSVESDDLPQCEDLSAAIEGVAGGLGESGTSPQFESETEETNVSITVYARDSVLVYGSEQEAANAFAEIDEEAFQACAAESVNNYADEYGGEIDGVELGVESPDEIDVSTGPGSDAGDESMSFELRMDSSVYGGQDNEERATLVVVRSGPAIVAFTFLYSGQYFEDFDTQAEDEGGVIQDVMARVDQALG